jgi:hypothetical protein
MIFSFNCYDVPEYQVKYVMTLDRAIISDLIYKVGDTYNTIEINGDKWESEVYTIDDKEYYYYIKLDSHEANGTFYIIKDNGVYNQSAIIADTRIENVFSGYINTDCEINIGL